MSAAIDEAVDTSDLNMLDGLRHAACNVCYPSILPFGERFVAVCGRAAVASGIHDQLTPPNACRGCEAVRYDHKCPRCGA